MNSPNLSQRIVCPKCGQEESFKEHQLVGQTQWMRWSDKDECYWYEEVETDEVLRVEGRSCSKCGEPVLLPTGERQEEATTGARYEYAVLPGNSVVAILSARQRAEFSGEGYVADDEATRQYDVLIGRGFRWVRTDEGFAVFEREVRGDA